MLSSFSWEFTRYWFYQKSIEALTFIIVFLTANAFFDQKSIFDEYGFKVALGAIISYGVLCLYWPSTWLLTYIGKNGFRAYQLVELAFYFCHSVMFLSLFYGGIFGVSKSVDYTSPLVLGWASVLLINVIFLFWGKVIFQLK